MKGFNENVSQAIDRLKVEMGCSLCGYNTMPKVLQFHHIDPAQKRASISEIISRKQFHLLLLELSKCVVLCANCHTQHHFSEDKEKDLNYSKFKRINKTYFLELCNEYDAINPFYEEELYQKIEEMEDIIDSLLKRIETLENCKPPIKHVETILLDENVVIETYKKLGSYNKTTEALFGKGKRGTYYIEKIKPFIEKIDTKPNN